MTEERISEIEDLSIITSQTEKKREGTGKNCKITKNCRTITRRKREKTNRINILKQ